mmetsp:Transcript_13054/g.12904  ORF Transcript_13054/g.12904 Transcript_13054/m.12904 type:complete len:123 (+) Transcript_13054:783-1151(+)|eukprot:CAMPEP_0170542738 /NCGR_PEP_ID=MMETSP0211-20121228/2079_1 /TAXON_ID=311385 /ORGANISM="Pseudokeronopsis sp., Strain OXSARD2" /LENGTH=122 /DNA_ID=CAMNT_0010845905 /DNA_START=751 /DNA_END=1119 /DNA_ORIENTATION=-
MYGSFFIYIFAFVFPESPKQLFATYQFDELDKCLHLIQRVNMWTNPELKVEDLDAQISSIKETSMYNMNKSKINENLNFWTTVTNDYTLLCNTIIMLLTWFLADFSFYIICFTTKHMPGHIY